MRVNMEDTSFFVDLPSNASMQRYSHNHGGKYTVELPVPLELPSHQWEVALAEMVFTEDWNPVVQKDIWIRVLENRMEGGEWIEHAAYHLPKDSGKTFYTSVDTFWSLAVKPLIESGFKNVENLTLSNLVLEKDSGTKHVTIKCKVLNSNKTPVRIELSESIQQIFGFTAAQLLEGRFLQTNAESDMKVGPSAFLPNLRRGVNTLWIYTDIIKPHFTGDTVSTLLRVVNVEDNVSISRVIYYTQPHFFPLARSNISTINIMITSSRGREPLYFSSPVSCRLLFRRKKTI